jgi:hypothetical protein
LKTKDEKYRETESFKMWLENLEYGYYMWIWTVKLLNKRIGEFMKLVRNYDEKNIALFDENNNQMLELRFWADEFVWTIYSSKEIILTRDDELFYDNLNSIMNSQYIFSNDRLCSKSQNEIIWFSDGYCDIDDKESTDRVNRLIIKKDGDSFKIRAVNPFLSKSGIDKEMYTIIFSPAGNGQYTKNINTGTTFQDDMVNLYINVYNSKRYTHSKKL